MNFSEKKKVQWLKCSVQNYDWGIIGENSFVAKLYSKNSQEEIDKNKSYAEFWMGTHDSGPSFLSINAENADIGTARLKAWISDNPEYLGEKVVKRWGADLPFLFKVLSVAKALSIQAHPDKSLAEALHKSQPNIYKDSNHKPEMAIALTEFHALCGFVSLEELKSVLKSVPEIEEVVGNMLVNLLLNIEEEDGEERVKETIKLVFTKLMSASKDAISVAVSKLKNRLELMKDKSLTEKEELVLQLEKQYPADIGVISSFFFNYVNLKPGEALYLGANEPHAYISGECVECMATSDNVVRAGLTPKYRDVQTLCSMLTYKQGFPDILKGTAVNRYVTRYSPPFDEFEVERCILPVGESVEFPPVQGPSIFMVTNGQSLIQIDDSTKENKYCEEGDVFFVPSETRICITASDGGGFNGENRTMQLYRAGVNSRFLYGQHSSLVLG